MKKIATLMAEGFEELEMISVCDILRRADVEVVLVGQNSKEVESAHGFKISADILFDDMDFDSCEGIYIPGGSKGAENLKKDERVLDLVRKFDEEEKLIAAICAGPTVLMEAGILENTHVTSYPTFKDDFKGAIYFDNAVTIQSGSIMTSQGPATAPYFAFDILHYLGLSDEAEKIWDEMLFPILSDNESDGE